MPILVSAIRCSGVERHRELRILFRRDMLEDLEGSVGARRLEGALREEVVYGRAETPKRRPSQRRAPRLAGHDGGACLARAPRQSRYTRLSRP